MSHLFSKEKEVSSSSNISPAPKGGRRRQGRVVVVETKKIIARDEGTTTATEPIPSSTATTKTNKTHDSSSRLQLAPGFHPLQEGDEGNPKESSNHRTTTRAPVPHEQADNDDNVEELPAIGAFRIGTIVPTASSNNNDHNTNNNDDAQTTTQEPLLVAELAPDTDRLLEERMAERDLELPMAQVIVKEDDKETEQEPRQWSTKTILLVILVSLAVLGAILAASIVVTTTNGTNNNSQQQQQEKEETNNPPPPTGVPTATMGPTDNPTTTPRQWFQLGDEIGIQYSDDESGAAVAMSRNGLAVAIGAPSCNVGTGSVDILRFRSGGWERQTGSSACGGSTVNGGAAWGETTPFALDGLGSAVALNDAGNVVAIGIPVVTHPDKPWFPETTPPRPGTVEVYRRLEANFVGLERPLDDDDLVGPGYEPIGTAIVGPENNDQFGWSVDLSSDGTIVAIGSSNLCHVRVYELNPSTDNWEEQPPGDLATVCDSTDTSFGTSLALSESGTILAVGAPGISEIVVDANTYIDATKRGQLSVFNYTGESWVALGNNIVGEADGDAFGYALALSDDGMVLAASAPYARGGASFLGGEQEPKAGSCRLFEYGRNQQVWQQRGTNIDGIDAFARFGAAVSLSSDGNVLAVGAPGTNDNGDDSGSVRIFEFDEASNDWNKVGTIPGPFALAYAGYAVALSADGDVVVVGAPNDAAVSTDRAGDVRVYDSGVIKAGDFPITLSIELAEDIELILPESITLFLERLDVDREQRVLVSGIDTIGIPLAGEEGLTEIMLVEDGVYRFVLCCSYRDVSYQIFRGEAPTAGTGIQPFVLGVYDGGVQEKTFLASSSENSPHLSPTGETTTVTLEIQFDSRPEDVHWVITRNDMVLDSVAMRIQARNGAVAFGPPETYEESLSGLSVVETIALPVSPGDTTNFKFIFTDTGRDGICCEGGQGSYKLYEGDDVSDESALLFSGSGEGKRRAVHLFSIDL